MKASFATLGILAVASAAPASRQALEHGVKYDHAQVAWAWQPGSANIAGDADWKWGGKRWPCSSADLVPSSDYADETFRRVYGNTTFARTTPGKLLGYFRSHDAAFEQDKFTAQCDKTGRFEFNRVANGKYYVTVMFSGSTRTNVGLLRNTAQELVFKQVTVVDGQDISVDLHDS